MIKKICSFLILISVFGFHPLDDCGGSYRWDYKILIDPTVWPLLNNQSKPKTIHALVNIPRPATLGNKRTPYEAWKVTITAWVVMLGKEEDKDYHLVLTNQNRTDSLIAEVPDPSCDKLKHFPALKNYYKIVRDFVFNEMQDPPSAVEELDTPVKVKVTGFLFFDKTAHGHGHAKNGIEIHPIIKITKAD